MPSRPSPFIIAIALSVSLFLSGRFPQNTSKAEFTYFVFLPSVSNGRVEVEVLPNLYQYVSGDFMRILGEVRNNTAKTIDPYDLHVNFYDGNHNFVGTDSAYFRKNYLAPSEKACFDMLVYPIPVGWKTFEFEKIDYWERLPTAGEATVISQLGSLISPGDYRIIGQVRNDNTFVLGFVEMIGTLYDASGRVVGCEIGSVNGTDLQPGQTSAFQVNYFYRNYSDVVSYRLQQNVYK